MKRNFAIWCMAIVMLATASNAFAQGKSKADIPFDFHVGSATLPAGPYTIWSEPGGSIWFYNQDQHQSAVAMAYDASGNSKPPTRLTFHAYGSQCFLAKTSGSNGDNERHYAMSKAEKHLREERATLESERQVLLALK